MNAREIKKAFNQVYKPIIDEDYFPSKIVGVGYLNADGSNRSKALAECGLLEPMDLIREPGNPVDPKAVAVRRIDGGIQVGYLPERTAHDLLKQMDDPAGRWFAILHKLNLEPGTGAIVGANIIIAFMLFEKIGKSQ
jgi:hypothetical protein